MSRELVESIITRALTESSTHVLEGLSQHGDTYYLIGNTFPIKADLARLGLKWDSQSKAWVTKNNDAAKKAETLLNQHHLGKYGVANFPGQDDKSHYATAHATTKQHDLIKKLASKLYRKYDYPNRHRELQNSHEVRDLEHEGINYYNLDDDKYLNTITIETAKYIINTLKHL